MYKIQDDFQIAHFVSYQVKINSNYRDYSRATEKDSLLAPVVVVFYFLLRLDPIQYSPLV